MELKPDNEIIFEFESNAAASYLVLNLSNDSDIQQFQFNMIEQNPTAAIISMDIRRADNQLKIYYDITSKIALSKFIKTKRMTKQCFISMIKGVTKTIIESKSLLLDDRNFIIKEDFIYINPITQEIALVYVPINNQRDTTEVFKGFITNIIMYSIQLDCTINDKTFQKILAFVKSDSFSILSFHRFLVELESNVQEIIVKAETQTSHGVSPNSEPVKKEVRQAIKKEVKRGKGISFKVSGRFLFIQLFSLMLFMLIYQLLLVKQPFDIISLVGLLIVVCTIDIFMCVKLIGIKGEKAAQLDKTSSPASPNTFAIAPDKSAEVLNFRKREIFNKTLSSDINESAFPFEHLTDTVVIKTQPHMKPFLRSLKDEREETVEKIPITKKCFLIGRLSGQVDYVSQNNAVGKLHAEIISKNEHFYLKDLDSKNGSYINGMRIKEFTECEIQDKDHISFANSEYEFIING